MAVKNGFVPAKIDATRWESVEPLFRRLLARPVSSAKDLERWLLDRSELDATCGEAQTNLHIAMTCDTESKEAQEAYERYIETVPPKIKPVAFQIDRRQVELFDRFRPPEKRYLVLGRDTAGEVALFREGNVPIQTELAKLSQKYDQIAGAMTVQFEGQERTLPQMGRYQESTDRQVRESAWRAVAERRLTNRDAIDEVFDKMIALRDQMARNAGFKDFVGYAFRMRRRYDYAPEDCRTFHKSVEEVVVPFMRRLDERRKASLGVPSLRPWDLSVDEKGQAPLAPFKGGRELMAKAVRSCAAVDPRLGRMLATLGDGSNTRGTANGACLDLDSRKGKAPGGYQAMRDRERKPFIFMNAAGLHRDVETMVHEAGHAFHSILCRDEPLLAYREAPIEFCEVASMGMELLTMDRWGVKGSFYPDKADLARAKRKHLEDSVALLPWIATIDAFQHWIYSNPKHTRAERRSAWLGLDERFGHAVAWDGLDEQRANVWQRQMHLFGAPFYYIEYGIAQLGALQLWVKSLEKGSRAAVNAYFSGLSLGGSRPLPELFKGAGLKFDFGRDMVSRLVERVEREVEKVGR